MITRSSSGLKSFKDRRLVTEKCVSFKSGNMVILCVVFRVLWLKA